MCGEKSDEEFFLRMDVLGKRRKGSPERRWMDSVNVDLREKGLSGRSWAV